LVHPSTGNRGAGANCWVASCVGPAVCGLPLSTQANRSGTPGPTGTSHYLYLGSQVVLRFPYEILAFIRMWAPLRHYQTASTRVRELRNFPACRQCRSWRKHDSRRIQATELRSNNTARVDQTLFWRKLDDDLRAAEAGSDRAVKNQLGHMIAACRTLITQHRAKIEAENDSI
jgi:hypothetical protein